MTYGKRLFEVAIPLDAITKVSARENSIRLGHPSTLHLSWPRRSAPQAAILAQVVDSAHDESSTNQQPASGNHQLGRPLVPRRPKTQSRSMTTQFRRNPARTCLADDWISRRGIARKPERLCQGGRRPGHPPAEHGGPRL
jgi:putative DNA methylase